MAEPQFPGSEDSGEPVVSASGSRGGAPGSKVPARPIADSMVDESSRPEGELTYFESLLIVAAALYVTGRIGLQLSIPPSFTSILWPPTGIALAACLLGGSRMALSVLIGFF